jgi:hypothetical protein
MGIGSGAFRSKGIAGDISNAIVHCEIHNMPEPAYKGVEVDCSRTSLNIEKNSEKQIPGSILVCC